MSGKPSGGPGSALERGRRRVMRLVGGGTERSKAAVRSRYDQLPLPPERPAGWRIGPPDFVIIGAQKSGTTWWQGLLESHPQVHRPPGQRRELHFFDHFWDRWPTEGQFGRYLDYFARPDGSLVGEKTPGYLYQPWVAPMLHHVAPEARLIVLLRDPVERYISGLGLLHRSGALKGEVGAGEVGTREHRITEAIDRSRYANQLAWWLRHYPREQILLLQYERCVADTQAELARTQAFLGLSEEPAPDEELTRTRKRSDWHAPMPDEMRRFLADYYADDVAELGELMPDLDRTLWPSMAARTG